MNNIQVYENDCPSSSAFFVNVFSYLDRTFIWSESFEIRSGISWVYIFQCCSIYFECFWVTAFAGRSQFQLRRLKFTHLDAELSQTGHWQEAVPLSPRWRSASIPVFDVLFYKKIYIKGRFSLYLHFLS